MLLLRTHFKSNQFHYDLIIHHFLLLTIIILIDISTKSRTEDHPQTQAFMKNVCKIRQFLDASENDDGKMVVLCTYSTVSIFENEEEVLIMPQNTFKMKNIRRENNLTTIEMISIQALFEGFILR